MFFHRLAGYATFKSVEEATSAKLRLKAKGGPVYPGGPPLLVSYYDPKRSVSDTTTPSNPHDRLMVRGLGPRASLQNVSAFFQPAEGLQHIRVSELTADLRLDCV